MALMLLLIIKQGLLFKDKSLNMLNEGSVF